MKIAILGAGMVGRAMALDLAKDHTVSSFDRDEANLRLLKEKNNKIRTVETDLSRYQDYPGLLEDMNLVITAVPGFMGFSTLEAAIQAGKNVVDISFFPENALELEDLARKKGVTVITDCGVAPGMSNLIIGYHNEQMKIESLEIYVGGLPKVRKRPFQYKAPFSPADVIEEYTRPARLMENGQVITRPALSEREFMDFEEIGTLEAFNTDGLRSLLFTMPHIQNQKEKTLRYPGHVDLIIALRDAGFFDEDPIRVEGNLISPLKFSSQILFNEWRLGADEEELTIMKVLLEGEGKRVEYHLLDRFDQESGTSSMARTTGYTCTAAANLLMQGLFTKKGVFPPELVGKEPVCFQFIWDYLQERGVNWKRIA